MATKFRVRRVEDGWRVHMPHFSGLNLTVQTWAEAIGHALSMVGDLQRDARLRAELGMPARRYLSESPWDPDF